MDGLRIAVLVKQVPATDTVKIDEKTGVMIRDGIETELNPLDLHAVEAALQIKERLGPDTVKITAISMGPAQAEKTVRYAVAMGCDDGVLLSDKTFGGSDTLATARTIARAIEKNGAFNLIFAGERATDGETGQVGPAVAEFLKIPVVTYASGLNEIAEEEICAVRSIEGGYETVRTRLPALVVALKEMNVPRLCTLEGKIKAKNADIKTLSADDLGLMPYETGISGSATQVVNIRYPKVTRRGRTIAATARIDEALDAIAAVLEDKNLLEASR